MELPVLNRGHPVIFPDKIVEVAELPEIQLPGGFAVRQFLAGSRSRADYLGKKQNQQAAQRNLVIRLLLQILQADII